MVIPWPSLTTQHGAILGATRRDGAIFAHCCAGQSLHGMTMPRPVRLALRKNDLRRRRDLFTDKLLMPYMKRRKVCMLLASWTGAPCTNSIGFVCHR